MGGDGAVTALRQLALPGCKLMEWGHRLSFAYLSRWEGEEDALSALAEHLIQTGDCSAPPARSSFWTRTPLGEGEAFCRSFLPCWSGQRTASVLPFGEKGEGACTLGRPGWSTPPTGCPEPCFPAGLLPHPAGGPGAGALPLHGNVLVKCLPQKALLPVLRRQKGPSPDRGAALSGPGPARPLTQLLARAGVTRIAPPGSMSRPLSGEEHDGEFPLRRYVRTVDIQEPSPDRPI